LEELPLNDASLTGGAKQQKIEAVLVDSKNVETYENREATFKSPNPKTKIWFAQRFYSPLTTLWTNDSPGRQYLSSSEWR
jgi:hypothetical protein